MSGATPSELDRVVLNGRDLSILEVVAVARHRVPVELDQTARARVLRCRAVVDHLVARGVKVYGLTTGFGSKRDIFIDPAQTLQLQANLIQSHAAGVGEPLPEDVVRAAMLLRANTLARGNSGMRDVILDKLMDMLNKGVFPYIPAKGSVGASGDLAPLSHLTLVLMGHPAGLIHAGSHQAAPGLEARKGLRYVAAPRREDFVPATAGNLEARFDFTPIELEAKEGLALNNGTQVMTAIGLLTAYDADVLIKQAEIVAAASFEALKGVVRAFDPRIHQARPHAGQVASAANLRDLVADSEILALPLNMAMVRSVYQLLEQAIVFLELRPTPLTEDIIGSLRAGLLELGALQGDPWAQIRNGIETLPTDERERWASSDRELRGAQSCLRGIKTRLHNLSHALLSSAIPDEAHPARECLTEAIASLERAVPRRPRVQDDYSIRCTPQVLGSARDTVAHAWRVLEVEINSATDNPLIFPPEWVQTFDGPLEALRARLTEAECVDAVFSGGNFHGEPIGMVMDFTKVALAEVGNISERRTAHLVDGHLNQGLPSLLIERSGLNSGLMIPQYTAAALVSENKVLAHPATVDSVPTCENTEDHVSMGTIAARQAREILHNVELIIAIECLTAFQALHFRLPFRPGIGVRAFIECLSENGMTFIEDDRVLYPDIERACGLVRQERILDAVQKRLGGSLRGLFDRPEPGAPLSRSR